MHISNDQHVHDWHFSRGLQGGHIRKLAAEILDRNQKKTKYRYKSSSVEDWKFWLIHWSCSYYYLHHWCKAPPQIHQKLTFSPLHKQKNRIYFISPLCVIILIIWIRFLFIAKNVTHFSCKMRLFKCRKCIRCISFQGQNIIVWTKHHRVVFSNQATPLFALYSKQAEGQNWFSRDCLSLYFSSPIYLSLRSIPGWPVSDLYMCRHLRDWELGRGIPALPEEYQVEMETFQRHSLSSRVLRFV